MPEDRSKGPDRRSRVRKTVAVEVKVIAPAHHFVLLSRSVDISAGGVYVRSNRTLPVGSEVTVEFPRGELRNPLAIEAKVVRVGQTSEGRARGLALQFSDVSTLDAAIIDELILAAQGD